MEGSGAVEVVQLARLNEGAVEESCRQRTDFLRASCWPRGPSRHRAGMLWKGEQGEAVEAHLIPTNEHVFTGLLELQHGFGCLLRPGHVSAIEPAREPVEDEIFGASLDMVGDVFKPQRIDPVTELARHASRAVFRDGRWRHDGSAALNIHLSKAGVFSYGEIISAR